MKTTNPQLIALYTLVRREVVRMFRIASQSFLPSIITTLLYFLIFGSVVGQRIGPINGENYTTFIAPGLVMMAVITNAYANVSTSLFSVRFQRSIEEMLVSPMHWSIMLLGYTLGGVLRGLLVAVLVIIVSFFFTDICFSRLPLTLLIVILVSALFSLAGFMNGMLARTFDDVAIVPTFILTPLIYLGGVFYSSAMLPPFWQHLNLFNPIYYMINALRYAMLGTAQINITLAMSIIIILLLALITANCRMIKKGTGLRE